MATLKEQLDKQKKLRERARQALKESQARAKQQGLKTIPAIGIAENAIKSADTEIKRLETEINKKKTEEQTKKSIDSGTYTPTLPIGLDDKILNEIRGMGINISPETFNVGGIGSSILVYQGTTPSKMGIRGKQVTINKPKVELANNVINSFWEDKTIQNKVLSALIAAGNRNATQLDAFATWQSIVQQSAQLYNAGRGPKFTPMDILNMSINKAGGKPDVSIFIDEKKDIELKQTLKDKIFPFIQKTPDDNDPIFKDLFESIKNVVSKGIKTTTTIDPKTGVKTVKQTGGMTDQEINARIQKAYKNSQDMLEAKSLEATDYFSQWMRS